MVTVTHTCCHSSALTRDCLFATLILGFVKVQHSLVCCGKKVLCSSMVFWHRLWRSSRPAAWATDHAGSILF